jgi:hypothetical protein
MATKKVRGNLKSVNRLHVIARLLVDAAVIGDEAAAAKHGIHLRSVRRYRALAERGEGREALLLANLVQEKRQLADTDFSVSLKTAIHELLGFLSRAAVAMDPTNPHAMRVAAGALKMASMSYERFLMLDARLGVTPPVALIQPKAIKAA